MASNIGLFLVYENHKNLTLLPNTPDSIPLSDNAFCFVLWLIVFFIFSLTQYQIYHYVNPYWFSIQTQPYNNHYLRTLMTVVYKHNIMSFSSVYSTICTITLSVKLNLFQKQTQLALVIRCLFVTGVTQKLFPPYVVMYT